MWLFILIANLRAEPCIETPPDSLSIKEFLSLDIKEQKDESCPDGYSLLDLSTMSNVDIDFQEYQGKGTDSIEGARVFHQKFGYGKVVNLDGEKAEVKFEKSAQRKIFIKYLQFIL